MASPGAEAYPRHAKQVKLSPAAAAMLGTGPAPISPPELVRRYYRRPPTCFFGGVGTFVKAFDESDIAVDDSANDDVRVDARQLRRRVIAEGRQPGHYSARPGRLRRVAEAGSTPTS